MAKGPKINNEIVCRITRIHVKQPNWSAKEVQREIQANLRGENPKVEQGWPGLSAIQKVLTVLRKMDTEKAPEVRGLDSPWSVITLAEYAIPPEALRTVLNMAVYFRKEEGLGRRMTIREARWAAWLSSMTDLHKLFYAIQEYAEEEKAMEISGLRDGFTFMIDDELYGALTDKTFAEPVFDEITGLECENQALQKIRLGVEQQRHIKPANKRKIRNIIKRKENGG